MKNFSIYGNLVDRYLFNFRVDSDALENHLPKIPWIRPRNINGYGVVSFCLLKLKGLTVWPLPTSLGLGTTSCAYRCAVIDESGKSPEPSVYVLGRNTDLSIISRLGPVLFSGNIRKIDASINRNSENINIVAEYEDGKKMFSATVDSSKPQQNSRLFESTESFESFIKNGTSSYTPSTCDDKYSRIDLETDSNIYQQVNAKINANCLDEEWNDIKLVFDSAYRAGGKLYKLRNVGSVSASVS